MLYSDIGIVAIIPIKNKLIKIEIIIGSNDTIENESFGKPFFEIKSIIWSRVSWFFTNRISNSVNRILNTITLVIKMIVYDIYIFKISIFLAPIALKIADSFLLSSIIFIVIRKTIANIIIVEIMMRKNVIFSIFSDKSIINK